MAKENGKKPQNKRKTLTKRRLKSVGAVRSTTQRKHDGRETQVEATLRDMNVAECGTRDSTPRPDGFVAGWENPTISTQDRADLFPATTPMLSTSAWMCEDTVATAYDGDDDDDDESCSTEPADRTTTTTTTLTTADDREEGHREPGSLACRALDGAALALRAASQAARDAPRARAEDGPRSRGCGRPRSRATNRPRSRSRSRSRSRGRSASRAPWPAWSRKLWARFFYESHTCTVPAGAFCADRWPRSAAAAAAAGARDWAPWTGLAESDPPAFEVDASRTADGAWSVRLQWTDRDDHHDAGETAAADGQRSYDVWARRCPGDSDDGGRAATASTAATAAARDDGLRFLCRVHTGWPSVSLRVHGLPVGFAYQLCVCRVGGTCRPLGVVRTEVLTELS